MLLLTDGDLVVGHGSGDMTGLDCPDALAGLPLDALRVRDGEVVDARQTKSWFIDAMGRKHVEAADGRQPLACALGDALVRGSDGTWGVTPPMVAPLGFLDFMALFTADEQAAIVNATDPRVRLFCLMAAGATAVDLTDPRTMGGAKLLESLGLIAKGRAAQVLAGKAPVAS